MGPAGPTSPLEMRRSGSLRVVARWIKRHCVVRRETLGQLARGSQTAELRR